MAYKLFLEDDPIRTPNIVYGKDSEFVWHVVRNFVEFKDELDRYGIPESVSFDHDLGEDSSRNGAGCVEYFIDAMILTGNICKDIRIHSMNDSGSLNMISKVNSFFRSEGLDYRAKRTVWW